ncbi:hypothetical protein E2562_036092 [Oryza meyeriana var. granulata]|uniref:Secreted protein n=1 Tax=Oryza meyeriana var. granulata TaxID=110450 RepID=A0A6G1DT55_9ORYZ|nr:hypothetical protein E2562_036092 [Oryza meyeriana var. granulata]
MGKSTALALYYLLITLLSAKAALARVQCDAIGQRQHTKAKDGNRETHCRVRGRRHDQCEDGFGDTGLCALGPKQPPQATGLELS